MVKKGNVLELILAPAKAWKGSPPTIRGIRLIQGTIKDVPRHLDGMPENGR